MDIDKYLEHSIISRAWNLKLSKETKWTKKAKSNLLRVLLPYDHGGAYFDLDTISAKAIPEDIKNFCQIG